MLAVRAARDALPIAQAPLNPADIRAKGDRDLTTPTDEAIEDAIRMTLAGEAGATVVGEERGGMRPSGNAPYWLVDPLCGTRNHASGVPLYCVNVAFVESGVVTAAVVADAGSGQILAAERGAGAWRQLDDGWSRLSTTSASRTLVIEDSHASGRRREWAARFVAAAIRADRWDIRSLGTTLALGYLACGRTAGYALFWTSAVHAAAGSLLVTEAGGLVTDLDGVAWTVDADSIVASADAPLHELVVALLRDAESR